ncbi:winged helix-turn-helix domain-containing protein [Actinocorallia sp. API 0066]|uniref:AfsR/SARP family transcriptional regulator n=1 Tax=Actinocorallia sp. API 0066 TaxID=2896846 RepID=UPI001E344EDA|nr:AfsR/SARP family transcriptional regulator [Actinocorallia sp. API 0066]MCD0449349.1 winged helix-turn-helix domain-containing protein [Actinocorallia sp. API 0066]
MLGSSAGGTGSGRLTFGILGPLQVQGPHGPVRIPPGRQETIFAALLLEADRVVSTDYLVDLIWDEDPPDTARTQVQICVSRLRKALAKAGITAVIATRPPGYRLETGEEELDLSVFRRTVAQARVLVKEGRAAEAAEQLRSVVDLWRGPCLSGVPSEALRTKALRLDEDRLAATETYLDLEMGLGRHHQLVGEIGRLVHEHPLRERLRAQYMLALYRSGRQAEALETYREGRDLLVAELGLEPGEELRLLETAILAGDPALQADAPRPAPEPPRQAVGYRKEKPHQLPADTADFVGDPDFTERAADAVGAAGSGRAVPVVILVGRPGVGKSTMAAHIAHRLGDEVFPDGQLYCDLRGTSAEPVAAQEVLGRFLRALGIPGTVIPDALDERAEMYRTLLATQRTLVVLDDAAGESQISPLLPGSGNCAVLVTSRARLTGLPGARRFELDVLDVPRSLDLLRRVVGPERMDREPQAAEALVRAVGGLPLALRIVASRLAARPHWSLASMVQRLADERHRLDELAHGEMTVRASLSLTHDGLPAQHRRLLRLLSLAEGPVLPGWLAGALLDDDRPRPADLLEALVDVQMLDVVAVEPTGEFRYRFHEIIRMFAREQLAELDSPAARRAAAERMIGGWLALAEQAHRRIYGGDFTVLHGRAPRWRFPDGYAEALLADPLDWMDREHVNLVAAVEQAAQEGLGEACWDLATTLVSLFEPRGYSDLWERTHLRALEAARESGSERGTAALLASLGTLQLNRRRLGPARGHLDEALTLFDRLDERHGTALCLRDLALLERLSGRDDRALSLYERATRDFDRVGDTVGKAIVLTQSAPILDRRGEGARALAQVEEALAVYRSVGYVGGEARALRRMGLMLLRHGDPVAAEDKLAEALALVRAGGDLMGEIHLLVNLGELHLAGARPRRAAFYLRRALAIREQIMDVEGAAALRREIEALPDGADDPEPVTTERATPAAD